MADIPNMLPKSKLLPPRRRVSATCPPDMRAMLQATAEDVAGKSDFTKYMAAYHLLAPIADAGGGEDIGPIMVAAFIEIAGLPEDRCESDFMACLYRLSAKANHTKAARDYIMGAGGWDAVTARMNKHLDEHPEEIQAPGAPIGMRGINVDPRGPQTLESLLEHYTEMAKAVLAKTGNVELVRFALDRNGGGIGLFATRGMTQTEHKEAAAFCFDQKMPEPAFLVCMATQWMVSRSSWEEIDAWRGRVKDAEDRQEVVQVLVEDRDGNGFRNLLYVERDWQTGEPSVGEIEHYLLSGKLIPGDDA